MPRAYSPRRSTVDLMGRILQHPNITNVRPVAPNRHRGTLLRLTWANGRHDDLTLPDARDFVNAMGTFVGPVHQSVADTRQAAALAAYRDPLARPRTPAADVTYYRLADVDGNVVGAPFAVPAGAVVVRFYDADGSQVGAVELAR